MAAIEEALRGMKLFARSGFVAEHKGGTVGISTQDELIVSILLYGFVLRGLFPERFHFIANAVLQFWR